MTRAEPVTGYQRTYSGRAEQVREVRRDLAQYLGDCPVTDDMVLIADELDIVEVLTGADGWDTETTSDGGRVVWAQLSWEAGA
jgi:hypothetical protein